MNFGMPTLIENNTLIDNIALCKDCGFDFVELNMNLPEYQVEQLEKCSELKAVADDNNIYFTIHLDENLNFCDFNNAVSNAYFDTVKRTINAALELNVPILNMHMANGVYFTLPSKKVYLFEKYKDYYFYKTERFAELCSKLIGNADLKVCIENTDGYHDYQKQAIDIMLGKKQFGLTWDIGHSHAVNDVDENFILSRKDRLTHFHIHDGLNTKNHIALGTGKIDLKNRLETADKCNARCVVETKTIQSLKESAVWLKEHHYI